MQVKKIYQEKLFLQFQLSDRVPADNFYRRLKQVLQLDFLYKQTKAFYGDSGQKSIDPVVFFKICLVGYLENIISDRKLIEHCSMRMDILFFLGYDIDESLPWHSTISRTRKLFPEIIFEKVFTKVFEKCVDKGMVAGHTQAIDSAPVKANASMDSLELKVPKEELSEHLRKVRYMSSQDRKAHQDQASDEDKTLKADQKQLNELEKRAENWSKKQDQRPGSRSPISRYTSNKTHYSPVDPDARISVKPGKARKLNYAAHLTVDTAHHLIVDMMAGFADKKDNQYLDKITKRVSSRLKSEGLVWENVLADTGYSSGENYAFLEQEGLRAFIPAHGTFKGGPEEFQYHKEEDYYLCPEGKKLLFKRTKPNHKGILVNHYATRRKDCKGCPISKECKGVTHEKRITVTYYKEEYERAIKRGKTKLGRAMKKKRQSTVEPVFGVLTQFMGLRKINTRGIAQAQKVMLLSAVAYNLKKYLKFSRRLRVNVHKAIIGSLSSFLKDLELLEAVFRFEISKKEIEFKNKINQLNSLGIGFKQACATDTSAKKSCPSQVHGHAF
jgi:transposase